MVNATKSNYIAVLYGKDRARKARKRRAKK